MIVIFFPATEWWAERLRAISMRYWSAPRCVVHSMLIGRCPDILTSTDRSVAAAHTPTRARAPSDEYEQPNNWRSRRSWLMSSSCSHFIAEWKKSQSIRWMVWGKRLSFFYKPYIINTYCMVYHFACCFTLRLIATLSSFHVQNGRWDPAPLGRWAWLIPRNMPLHQLLCNHSPFRHYRSKTIPV